MCVERIEHIPLTQGNVVYTYYYSNAEMNNDGRIDCLFLHFRKPLLAVMCFILFALSLISFLAPLHQNEHKLLSKYKICAGSSVDGICTKNETPPSTFNITVELFGELKFVYPTDYQAYIKEISFEDINDQDFPVKFQFNMQLVGVTPNVTSLGGSYLQCETTTLDLTVKLDANSSFSFRFFGRRARKFILRLTRGCFHLPKGIKLNINHHSIRLIPIVTASKLLNIFI